MKNKNRNLDFGKFSCYRNHRDKNKRNTKVKSNIIVLYQGKLEEKKYPWRESFFIHTAQNIIIN